MEGGRLKGGRLIEVLLYLLVTQASREHNWRQFPQVTLRLPHATFLASGHDSANSPQLVMRVSDRVDILWLLKRLRDDSQSSDTRHVSLFRQVKEVT